MKFKQALYIFCTFACCNSAFGQASAKPVNNKANRPLKNINYMAVNAKFGAGFNTPKLTSNDNWKTTSGVPYYFGIGYSFAIKNSWIFDLQISEEFATYEVSNIGPYFKTGYAATGAEVGIKKTFAKNPDDTFFFRGAFGYNFLISASKSGSSDFYNYTTSTSGNNMYVLPELGYQLRLADARHMFNFSVNYKYSLSPVASATMNYFQTGKTTESNTMEIKGSYVGASVSYIYIVKGFEDKTRKNIKVDSHF